MEKTLNNTTANQAKDQVSDIQFWGNGDAWKLLGKASSKKEGWMKSSKAYQIDNVGCIVQVTTQQGDNVAEALTFVSGVRIEETYDQPKGGKVISRRLVLGYNNPIESKLNTGFEVPLSISDKQRFVSTVPGSIYHLPIYTLGKQGIEQTGEGLPILYIRGVTNNPEHPVQDGVLNETLLAMIKFDLELKNKEVPSEYTEQAIYHIGQALHYQEQRAASRMANNTLNTNLK